MALRGLRTGDGNAVSHTLSAEAIEHLVERCRALAPATGVYLEDDFITNLMATVIDFQMHSTAVVRAIEHYKAKRGDEVRTMDDLENLLSHFPDDQQGNTALAQYLWGYNLWTRAHLLRGLADMFRNQGVVDQPGLRDWATRSDFKRDFEGRVKGLGYAVYKWLVMRQGVETVKPDVHVRRFVEAAVGMPLTDAQVVEAVEEAARQLGLPASALDWAIWESARQ